jgi:hypothetical protein
MLALLLWHACTWRAWNEQRTHHCSCSSCRSSSVRTCALQYDSMQQPALAQTAINGMVWLWSPHELEANSLVWSSGVQNHVNEP